MSSKFSCLGVFGLILVLCISGCKNCGCGSGRDPLLGKTRVDPPTTNARSVYVERQNVNECGVVPGGGPAGIIQPGAGSVQTVHYPSGLDSTEASVSDSSSPSASSISQDQKPAENAHLHWISAEAPKNEGMRGPSLSDLGTHELTEEELANYRYVYDFSVMPPRKVPVGRPAGAVPSGTPASGIAASGNPASGNPASGNAAAQGYSPDPYVPQTRQFVSQSFDPYAPNRQFERRKANLSRTMASEFDEVEANPAPVQIANSAPYSASAQTANPSALRNQTTYESAQVAQTQISAKDSGWRVIAAPDPAFSPSVDPLSNEAVADSQAAPVNQAVGTKAQVPGKASEKAPEKVSVPENVSAPEKVSGKERENVRENSSEKVRENASEKVRENARENVPQNPKTDEDSAVDLFALPRK